MFDLTRALKYWPFILGFSILTACQTNPGSATTPLNNILSGKDVVFVDYKQEPSGLIYVPVNFEDKDGYFLLDTGATRSAIFDDTDLGVMSEAEPAGTVNIFGLVEVGTHQVIKVQNLTVMGKSLNSFDLAILPKQERTDLAFGGVDGILGMDFLHSYKLYVDEPSKTLHLIPKTRKQPDIIHKWTPLKLYSNPNGEFGNSLNFFNLRVGSHILPALLDTGSELNLINWNATIVPELNRLEKRLRMNWKIQGATGNFDPAVRIGVTSMKAGQMRWKNHEFIVMNFDHLDSIGFEGKPLVVAGMPVLAGQRFFVDFEQRTIWFEPKADEN